MNKTFFILGCMRSGTSLTTKLLVHAGIPAGTFFDDRGYEDHEFSDINTNILAAAGGNNMEPPPQEKIDSIKYPEKAKAYIEKRNENPVWCVKSPLATLTFDNWIEYLRNPHLIVCTRSIDTIRERYDKAGGFPLDKSNGLYQYEKQIEKIQKMDIPQIEMPFDEYFSKEYTVDLRNKAVEKLGDFVGRKLNPKLIDQQRYFDRSQKRYG